MHMFGSTLKTRNQTTHGGKQNDYRKDYMKIKFNSDYDLNKPLKFHAMTIIIRSVFEEGGKLYSQVFLDDVFFFIFINAAIRKNWCFRKNWHW